MDLAVHNLSRIWYLVFECLTVYYARFWNMFDMIQYITYFRACSPSQYWNISVDTRRTSSKVLYWIMPKLSLVFCKIILIAKPFSHACYFRQSNWSKTRLFSLRITVTRPGFSFLKLLQKCLYTPLMGKRIGPPRTNWKTFFCVFILCI